VYMLTHTGLSYSRTFVSSLIILPMTVAMVMTVLDNNIVTAFSLMAVFAIVRFRNIVRDTLDTMYLLSLIVIGMACGTQKYSTALVGTGLAGAVLLYLWWTSFGSRMRYDQIVALNWNEAVAGLPVLEEILSRHARKAHCASHRASHSGTGTDLSYRVLLRDPARTPELLEELQKNTASQRVSLMKVDDESEV
jgi:hypothetical protein